MQFVSDRITVESQVCRFLGHSPFCHFVRSELVFYEKILLKSVSGLEQTLKKKNLALNTPIPFLRGFFDYLIS